MLFALQLLTVAGVVAFFMRSQLRTAWRFLFDNGSRYVVPRMATGVDAINKPSRIRRSEPIWLGKVRPRRVVPLFTIPSDRYGEYCDRMRNNDMQGWKL